MADESRQPVAIRVSRPYASEDEFLEHELETLTRTSVTLVGSQSRPQGVILRFEVALSNGTALLRGEGRVVAYKQNAFGALPGLTLRFTRLDSKSKALVDRAASQREARARAAFNSSMTDSVLPAADASDAANATVSIPPSPSAPAVSAAPVDSASLPPASVASASLPPTSVLPSTSLPPASILPASSPAPASVQPASARPRSMPRMPSPLRAASTPPHAPARASTPPAAAGAAGTARDAPSHAAAASPAPSVSIPRPREPATAVAVPADRASLLEKLRSRGKGLSPDAVARILTKPTS